MELDGKEGGGGCQPMVVILVGAPGSGKSTFCSNVMKSARRDWVRVCQDIIANGKAGTKQQCLKAARDALKEGRSVLVDRCNLDREQRADFLKLGGPQVDVHAIVLDLPSQVCISRCVKRAGHEGGLQGGKAAVVVNRMLQMKELPALSEGFSRITSCRAESDVEDAVSTYSGLGPSDHLPAGYFGPKTADAKVQVGIMKFFKKLTPPGESTPTNEVASVSSTDSMHTLAFPSIATADFKFNHEMASDIILKEVGEFLSKYEGVRLVLVDLTHGSKILSMVSNKAAAKNIDAKRFFTFVGDITRLHTRGGLQCSVIANTTNWRLKPGGGGVNAAIFAAGGHAFEAITKERAQSLEPGQAVAVPVPSDSSLSKEGVSHVIHVLGPNMNPQRPNYLGDDYGKGCDILRMAYSSLFECFASTVGAEKSSVNQDLAACSMENRHVISHGVLQKNEEHISKRHCSSEPSKETKKKCKEVPSLVHSGISGSRHNSSASRSGQIDEDRKFESAVSSSVEANHDAKKRNVHASRNWPSWSLALYNIIKHPEEHVKEVAEITEYAVVLHDIYPKAKKHLLVVARQDGLDCLADVRREHLPLLNNIQDLARKWINLSLRMHL